MRATKLQATFVSILAALSVSATPLPSSATKARGPKHRVVIVDTGLNFELETIKPHLCPTGHRDFTGTGVQDDDGHGTEVAALIVANAGDANYCLVVYKFFTRKVRRSWNAALISAIREVHQQKFELANLSLSGEGFLQEEQDVFKMNTFTRFIVAAGNDGVNLDEEPRYPASYGFANIEAVGALDKNTNKRLPISNYGSIVRHWEKAEATSYATAIKTGKVIKETFGGRSVAK